MQKSFDFGASDNAAKRAGKITRRRAIVIGAAVVGYGGPITRYKRFVGFRFQTATPGRDFVHYVGNVGGVRIVPVDESQQSPRHARYLAKPAADRLERIGRNAVKLADLKPADWRNLESANIGAEVAADIRDKVAAVIGRERAA